MEQDRRYSHTIGRLYSVFERGDNAKPEDYMQTGWKAPGE